MAGGSIFAHFRALNPSLSLIRKQDQCVRKGEVDMTPRNGRNYSVIASDHGDH